MTQSLGEKLKANLAAEKASAMAAAAALAARATEETRRKCEIVDKFFAEAKNVFTNGILNGDATSSLYLQVGGNRSNSAGRDTHPLFNEILEGWNYRNDVPTSVTNPGKLKPFWDSFTQWARQEGLDAYWQFAHDGGGIDSWWLLRVRPLS